MPRIAPVALLLFVTLIAHAGVEEGREAFERGDYETALREIRPLAEAGDAEAQAALGLMYLTGKGLTRDHEAAAVLVQKSAAQGNALGQRMLAMMYRNGDGVPKDLGKAYELLTLYGAQEPMDAMYWMAVVAHELGPERRKEMGIVDPDLMYAIEQGNEKEVKKLLGDGSDPNLADGIGTTPLMMAMLYGDVSIVKSLLDAGADVNAVDSEGNNALSLAMMNNHGKVVQMLLERGAKIADASTNTLLLAAAHGDFATVKMLVDAGADPNTTMEDGFTLLMLACKIGSPHQLEVVKFLIEAGADVNARADDGTTALGLAREFERREVAAVLRDAGAKN